MALDGTFLGGFARGQNASRVQERGDAAQLLQEEQFEAQRQRQAQVDAQNAISDTTKTAGKAIQDLRAAGAPPEKIQKLIGIMRQEVIDLGGSPSAIDAMLATPIKVEPKELTPADQITQKLELERFEASERTRLGLDKAASGGPPLVTTPEEANIGSATGIPGAFNSLVNTIAGAVGGTLPSPEAAKSAANLEALNVETITTLQDAVPGKPSKFLLEKFEKIGVAPNSIFQGRDSAIIKFKEISALLDEGVANIQQSLASKTLTNSQTGKAIQSLNGLQSLKSRYDSLLAAIERQEAPQVDIKSFIRPNPETQ